MYTTIYCSWLILTSCNSFYIPGGPFKTSGLLRGKNGWFTERQAQIAVSRLIRDDKSKTGEKKKIEWHDVKIALFDTKLWTHLLITFTR